MKTRQPEFAIDISAVELRALAEELRRICTIVDDASLIATENGSIASFNYASGKLGMDRLRSFSYALADAVYVAKSGRPIHAGQTKPRSAAKKSIEKATKAIGKAGPKGSQKNEA